MNLQLMLSKAGECGDAPPTIVISMTLRALFLPSTQHETPFAGLRSHLQCRWRSCDCGRGGWGTLRYVISVW